MKNKSFKYTFYFGLVLILIISTLITLLSINIYNTVTSKNSEKKKIEPEFVDVPLDTEKEIVHDTIFLEKALPKTIDSPKQKKEIKVVIKKDSSLLKDTIE